MATALSKGLRFHDVNASHCCGVAASRWSQVRLCFFLAYPKGPSTE